MSTTDWIELGFGALFIIMWFVALLRVTIENEKRRKEYTERQRKANELRAAMRARQDEYTRSIAEEAARLDAAGILAPSVKARLVAQGIYG